MGQNIKASYECECKLGEVIKGLIRSDEDAVKEFLEKECPEMELINEKKEEGELLGQLYQQKISTGFELLLIDYTRECFFFITTDKDYNYESIAYDWHIWVIWKVEPQEALINTYRAIKDDYKALEDRLYKMIEISGDRIY